MKLSKRLECIASLIEKYASGLVLADIGTDHGYLPCYLVKHQITPFAYACDIAIGPINSSKATIQSMKLENQVIPCLGSGLAPVLKFPVEVVSISGMGGFLMEDIFKEDLIKMKNLKFLILQPNICSHIVREYLLNHGWSILDEDVVEDANHLYEVIVFKNERCHDVMKTPINYKFGPVLLKNKPDMFIKKWERELIVKERILNDLKNTPNHPKYKEIQNEIKEIKEAIYDCK